VSAIDDVGLWLLLVFYFGIWAGWGAKTGWEEDGFGAAVSNALLFLVMSARRAWT
jgi:hypothetical protein